MIHHRSTKSALAFALAAAAVSGFATLTFPASADVTAVHGMADNKATPVSNRATDPRSDDKTTRAVDTAFQGDPDDPKRPPTKFIGIIRDSRIAVRDPRTTPQWHDLSELLPRNFGRLVDISLAAPDEGTTVHITVLNERGKVAQSRCTVFPTPGSRTAPAWPENCTEFIDLTRM
ncbi:hypothetical protein ACIBQ1_40160 [Nonomuraea sp. NPDC050153]|uniref:hypothetical protein n=1 Tax=Nonomuraea sp. NPDC050153 TaxID=3364359 RepID=UPI0037B3FD13